MTKSNSATEIYAAFRDTSDGNPLRIKRDKGLVNNAKEIFPFIDDKCRVVDFMPLDRADEAHKEMYDSDHALEVYRNFLDWLFATFEEDETAFRKNLIERLRLTEGQKVLVTGCGFGEDLTLISELVGSSGDIHAQDLSKAMVLSASENFTHDTALFSVSSALDLPYQSRHFDAVMHFGGINLFGDIDQAILEMERVCKVGGRVLFGDEGIAPHLRNTTYGAVATNNNQLWDVEAPLTALPINAADIELSYVLGNCFYLISFSPQDGAPRMNIDIEHKGLRGGTARTRYYGQVEGVMPATQERLYEVAKERGISVHKLLEDLINSELKR